MRVSKQTLETKIDTLIDYYDELKDDHKYRYDLKQTYVQYLEFVRFNSIKSDKEQEYMTFMGNVYVQYYKDKK